MCLARKLCLSSLQCSSAAVAVDHLKSARACKHTASSSQQSLCNHVQCCAVSPATDDLEEALLFDFEAEETSLTPKKTARGHSRSTTPSGSLATADSLLSPLGPVHSITKDAAGTHVLAENFTMHIEEVGGTSSGVGT